MKIDKEGALTVLIKANQAPPMLRSDDPNINYPNLWSIPGGRVEEGETSKEAAIREFKEETGYSLKDPKLVHTETFERGSETIRQNVFLEVYDGKQEINCYEGQKVEFKNLEEIEKLDMVPRSKKILK